MPDSTPLHTLNPRQRFSNRADDYAKYRPSYPVEAIAAMLAGLGDAGKLSVADVGAGTGISSRLLAAQGANVWAIEPNAAMCEAAIPHSAVEFCAATAEATGLPDQSVQLVTCCQAFHWFEPVAALAEFQRILQPNGRVALMWNERDLSDPFTHGYTEAIRRAAEQHFFDRPDRRSASALERSPLFTHFRHLPFVNRHLLDCDGLIGLALSASYVPKTGDAHDRLLHDLEALFQQWATSTVMPAEAGTPQVAMPQVSMPQVAMPQVAMVFRTNVYLADRLEDNA